MQEKTTLVLECSARLGLNIHRWKSKVQIHAANANLIVLHGDILTEVDSSYIWVVLLINREAQGDTDTRSRMGKARVAFNQLTQGLEINIP
jgi:UDP-2,3-diacylglucosamine pyrophosphatase LpxH